MAQAILIQDTIAGMKRALQGSYSSESDSSVQVSTNRGQKLKRKAHHVQEGRLNSCRKQKRKIEHAGYHRFILNRNPRRYDAYGDELEEDEEDELADITAAESNPYGDIKLEHLLAPLASAAELPNHPSMSIPYRPQILGELVRQAREMVHKERQTLWGVKHLATNFRGDHSWVTSEALHLDDDASLFANNKTPHPDELSTSKALRQLGQTGPQSQNTDPGNTESPMDSRVSNQPDPAAHQTNLSRTVNAIRVNSVQGMSTLIDDDAITSQSVRILVNDPITVDAVSTNLPKNLELSSNAEGGGSASHSAVEGDIPISPETVTVGRSKETSNGVGNQPNATTDRESVSKPVSFAHASPDDAQEEDTRVPAHRMRTRAQAQALSDKDNSTHTRTPSTEPSILPDIHPLYLIPSSAVPDRDFGLPPTEAEETRCIMMLWIQKQEEICRSAERLYIGLLKSDRMRKTVFSWCKAEGHLGEMSDGEDWYDREEWGLEDELKKGQLEEDDDAANQGKKTRRRAQ